MCFALSIYSQGQQRLTSEAGGFSFEVPKDWTGHETGPTSFALINTAKTIVIEVRSHNYRNFTAFMADANLQRDGLEIIAKPQEFKGGTTFRSVKRTPNAMTVIDAFVLFTTGGGGVQIAAITDRANADAGFNAGLAIAGSVKFEVPKANGLSDQVRKLLAGKLLTYLYTGSGYSERKDILLCNSGTFYQTTDMGGFAQKDVDGPSFAATGGKSGSWSIDPTGSKLILRFQNGGTSEFTLSARQASNEIGLNNQRFFVQSQNRCQ